MIAHAISCQFIALSSLPREMEFVLGGKNTQLDDDAYFFLPEIYFVDSLAF